MPLLTLPTEMQDSILTHLPFLDLHTLRMTNHYFYNLIPPPTHNDLLEAEKSEIGLYACVGCMKLRRKECFSSNMTKKKKVLGGLEAHNRFCIECGRRPLPGEHQYTRGQRWDENGNPFVRCFKCQRTAQAPEDRSVQLCLSCHTQDLERQRQAEVRKRVQRESEARDQRRLLRAERRRHHLEHGGAASDTEEEDTSEEEYQDSPFWGYAGSEYEMNYSAHS